MPASPRLRVRDWAGLVPVRPSTARSARAQDEAIPVMPSTTYLIRSSAAATLLRDAACGGPQDKLACRRTLVVHAAAISNPRALFGAPRSPQTKLRSA